MRVRNYTLIVHGGVERSTGHVEVVDGQPYSLSLINSEPRRCDAELTVDGKVVGTFRLAAHQTLRVEGPPDDPAKGKFTAYAAASAAGALVGAGEIAAAERGVINVKFTPEKLPVRRPRYHGAGQDQNKLLAREALGDPVGGAPLDFDAEEKTSGGIVLPRAGSAAVTGLSGRHDQSWSDAPPMPLDHANAVVINVRLVAVTPVDPATPRPLRPAPAASNPVPPPVE